MLTQFLRTLAILAVIMAIVGAIFAIAPATSATSNGFPPQGRGGNPGQARPEGRGPEGGRGGQQSTLNNLLLNSGSVLVHFGAVSAVTLVVVLIERGIRSRKRNETDEASETEFANL